MPAPTFWSSEEKLPVSQTKVSIPSDNGLSYQGGQRIIFTIPDNIEFINPINTVLECDFKIDFPVGGEADSSVAAGWAQTRLQLDAELGGNVLIRHIRVYANSAEMPLLDEVQDCNVLAGVRYDYHTDDSIRKKRSLVEGCSMFTPAQRNIMGIPESGYVNTENNTCFDSNIASDSTGFHKFNAPAATSGFKTAKLLLPLHESGIFGSSVVFPNKVVGGLRLELELCEANIAVKQLDTVQLNNKFQSNPIFHSVDGLDVPAGAAGVDSGWKTTVVTDTFYLARQNLNGAEIAKVPFCIGERFSIKKGSTSISNTYMAWSSAAVANVFPRIKAINVKAAAVGTQSYDLIQIVLDEPVKPSTAIKSIANSSVGVSVDLEDPSYIYSTSLYGGDGTLLATPSFEPTYTLSNAALIVERVEMPEGYNAKMRSMMSQGGVLNYDFLTFTNYKYSQAQNDRVANIRIPIANKRCKGVVAVPVDSSVYTTVERICCGNMREVDDTGTYTYNIEKEGNQAGAVLGNHTSHSKRSAIEGVVDGLSRYQFFYSGKLNPSRPVVTSKIANRVSISQQSLVECEKCLAVCGIPPTSFSAFRRNFFVGRATAIQNGVVDLSTTDFNLQVEYQEIDNPPTKSKLWNIYIGHLRRLLIRGDSVVVDV